LQEVISTSLNSADEVTVKDMVSSLPLEQKLHERISKAAQEEPLLRSLLGEKAPKQFTRQDVEAFQLFLLKKTLSHVKQNSSFYRDVFRREGINPEAVCNLPDLALIPLTDPSDLAGKSNRFVCVSLAHIIRPVTFVSSGTTGPEKRVFFTEADVEIMVDFMEVGMRTVARAGDVVQIILPGGTPLGQLHLLSEAVERMGAVPVRAGTARSAREQLELIKAHGSTVLFGRTGRIYHITQELLQQGQDLSRLGVKVLFVSSEYLPRAMRERLQDIWNCEVSFHYGMSEMGLGVAVECEAHDGFHLKEWDLIAEVVDPATGEPVVKGEEGELVFTTLTREGMPLLRYRTHDFSRLIPEPCKCGSKNLLKFAHSPYRLEGLLKLGEDDCIYPGMLDEVLYELKEVVDYQAQLGRTDSMDTMKLVVEVTDTGDRVSNDIMKKLMEVPLIEKNVTSGKMEKPMVTVMPLNQLQRSGRAKKLIKDVRS
jgi:phenylacetate-coenzyme A ligase PaaK-like adenylate-forming protein